MLTGRQYNVSLIFGPSQNVTRSFVYRVKQNWSNVSFRVSTEIEQNVCVRKENSFSRYVRRDVAGNPSKLFRCSISRSCLCETCAPRAEPHVARPSNRFPSSHLQNKFPVGFSALAVWCASCLPSSNRGSHSLNKVGTMLQSFSEQRPEHCAKFRTR